MNANKALQKVHDRTYVRRQERFDEFGSIFESLKKSAPRFRSADFYVSFYLI